MSKELAKYSKDLKLDEAYGIVPHSYYISAADYQNNDEKSLLRFLEDEILIQLQPKSCSNKIEGRYYLILTIESFLLTLEE